MEFTGKETPMQEELTNAAKAATMLLTRVCNELDADNKPGFAKANPVLVAACMNAAVLWHISGLQKLGFGLVERFK